MSARFGQNLRALRLRAGLSQPQFAKRLGLKKSSTISHWERGDSFPLATTITRLAAALRCTTEELMVGVVDPYDALRGRQELPSTGLLLSEEETAMITTYRDLDPVFKKSIRETLLPVFAAATEYQRRRRRTRR